MYKLMGDLRILNSQKKYLLIRFVFVLMLCTLDVVDIALIKNQTLIQNLTFNMLLVEQLFDLHQLIYTVSF